MAGDAGNSDGKLGDKTAGIRVRYNTLTNTANRAYIRVSKSIHFIELCYTFRPFFGVKKLISKRNKIVFYLLILL